MIKIYNKEDDRFGLKYNEGVICNTTRPLNPHTDPRKKTLSDVDAMLDAEKKK